MKHIVFLHGLGSHGVTMRFIQSYFNLFSGYNTYSFSYYSITSNINQIISYIENLFNNHFSSNDEVCIIGHSLGGIIAAKIASSNLLNCKVSKIITLGSPHNGSLLANKIISCLPYIGKTFPIVAELSNNNIYKEYNITSKCSVGIISGRKEKSVWNPLVIAGSAILRKEKDHDGVVRICENIIDCKDYICMDIDHINLLWSPDVAKQCLSFINNNIFYR